MVGNQSLPSAVFSPDGWRPPLNSTPQAVPDAEHGQRDRTPTSRRQLVELGPAHSRKTPVRTHPEIAVVVFENLEDPVIVEALISRVAREPVCNQAIQSAVVGADPELTVSVFVEGSHLAADEAFGFAE